MDSSKMYSKHWALKRNMEISMEIPPSVDEIQPGKEALFFRMFPGLQKKNTLESPRSPLSSHSNHGREGDS